MLGLEGRSRPSEGEPLDGMTGLYPVIFFICSSRGLTIHYKSMYVFYLCNFDKCFIQLTSFSALAAKLLSAKRINSSLDPGNKG